MAARPSHPANLTSPVTPSSDPRGSFERFCSAFADVDAPFGSCGDFFSARFAEGSYEANPPFVPALIDRPAPEWFQEEDYSETETSSSSSEMYASPMGRQQSGAV